MNRIIVTSLQNAGIKQIKELQSKKSARKKQGLFIVEGLRGVKEIPKAEDLVQQLVVTERTETEIPAHLMQVKRMVVTEDIFAKISETQAPQGMLAIVKMPHYTLEEMAPLQGGYLLLENLQDPGNLGTIIRTAHAFGIKGIFLTKGCTDVFSPKVVRSTMSSLFYVPLVMDGELTDYLTFFKKHQLPLYVTALQDGAQPVQHLNFPKNFGLVIGNEGNGVSKTCLEAADQTMIIPMPGGAESLNASVAAAICMYEMTRSLS